MQTNDLINPRLPQVSGFDTGFDENFGEGGHTAPRVSCIRYPEGDPFFILSWWQLEAAEGDHCGGLIIGIMLLEWGGFYPEREFHNFQTLQRLMFNTFAHDSIRRSLKNLLRIGLLEQVKHSAYEAQKICAQKEPSSLPVGHLSCSWCGSQTLILQKHHYPVPESQGGKDVVKICGTCHAEFHYLTGQSLYRPSEKLKALFETKRDFLERVRQDDPGLESCADIDDERIAQILNLKNR